MKILRAIVLAVVVAPNLSVTPSAPRFESLPGFVGARGQQLVRHDQPFRFVGVNCFELADYADRADDIFGKLSAHHVKVVRFWAFQKHCGPTGRDFARFESLVVAARRHDVLLLPVLENHWLHCTYDNNEEWKPASWYADGWRADRYGGAPMTFRDYARAVTGHFRDEPQIICWQLMNEAEIEPSSPANARVLRQFALDATREVRETAPHHLVSLGLLGVGQPSTEGDHFARLHNFRDMTIVAAHDHGYWDEPLPGHGWRWLYNTVAADMADAGYLQKPFLITEAGIPVDWVKGDLALRAEKFRVKLRAFSRTGTSGYILWNYEPSPCTDYGFGPDDPIWPVLKEAAGWF
jgi:endo-1,4-beta-mannosidase